MSCAACRNLIVAMYNTLSARRPSWCYVQRVDGDVREVWSVTCVCSLGVEDCHNAGHGVLAFKVRTEIEAACCRHHGHYCFDLYLDLYSLMI
jgi:hypothetical protein